MTSGLCRSQLNTGSRESVKMTKHLLQTLILLFSVSQILACITSFDIVLICTNVTSVAHLSQFERDKIIFIDFMNSSVVNIKDQITSYKHVEWLSFRDNSDISCHEIEALKQYYIIDSDGICNNVTRLIENTADFTVNSHKSKVRTIILLCGIILIWLMLCSLTCLKNVLSTCCCCA